MCMHPFSLVASSPTLQLLTPRSAVLSLQQSGPLGTVLHRSCSATECGRVCTAGCTVPGCHAKIRLHYCLHSCITRAKASSDPEACAVQVGLGSHGPEKEAAGS